MRHVNVIDKYAQKFNGYQLQQEYHYIVKSPIIHI